MSTIFISRYHIGGLFALGAATGILLTTCAQQPPRTIDDCRAVAIQPFLHRRPIDVMLGELRDLVIDLQRCSSDDTLFTQNTDLFGIGAFPGELDADGGIYRGSP